MAFRAMSGNIHKPTLQDQRNTINTVIDDSPQDYRFSFNPKQSNVTTTVTLGSPMHDDFPTPRGPNDITAESPSSVGSSTCTSDSEWARSRRSPDFDELYDVSDDDDMEVPLKISNSVKSTLQKKIRIPSITIPSPTTWPTIEKLQKAMKSPVTLSPPPKLDIPAAALAKLDTRGLQVPTRTSTPSLDESQTGDEMSSSACPSTPDLSASSDSGNEWDAPIQLHPEAMETLHQISPDLNQSEQAEQPLEVHPTPFQEMQQVPEEQRRHSVNVIVTPTEPAERADDPISALSVPSPGGFFSSLDASARHTWCIREKTPTTGTAESFYGVPWRTSSDETVRQVITVASTQSPTEGPPTARRIPLSTEEVDEISEIRATEIAYEYNENYESELAQQASTNFDRTSLWLAAQSSYLSALRDTNPANDKGLGSPMVPLAEPRDGSPVSPPSRKKSVRFIDGVPKTSSQPRDKSEKAPCDPTFYQGFQHLRMKASSRDALHHGQHRAEALHLKRQCLTQAYRNQLLGKYELNDPLRPTPNRPISSFLPNPSDPDEEKAMIAAAEKERQALEQLHPSSWNLEAMRILNGGRLLNSPAASALSHPDARVLDLGGDVACDWGWAIALTHPHATITSATTLSDLGSTRHLRGPRNHRRLTVPNLWTLPFPSNHFDLISARSLHALLRTSHASPGSPNSPTTPRAYIAGDEYDLCLRECLRVLKPGGYLEFSVLDAELLRPSPLGAALGVEFAFSLKTRGYDPTASRCFIRRLARAGFADVKRAWMVLPMADVAPRWTDRGKKTQLQQGQQQVVDQRPRAWRSRSDGTIGW
ncbi:hypothetical protein EV356DRAFT_33348 [Viridothelium virens]|uniref:Uncharacterized protein n=1 Tax=Viridothelium virens TaxID=1048519 RepID=A0A6A6GUH2_VIRVR|nr:hypothetical protein EV356DRAFT_33348 [Viridothelium virens]